MVSSASSPSSSASSSTAAASAAKLTELERSFVFYASYHNEPINQAIHIVCVWPILFTALIFLSYTPHLPLPASLAASWPAHHPIDGNLVMAISYIYYYLTIERGSSQRLPSAASLVAAGLVVVGYFFARWIVAREPSIWKPSIGIHIGCWIAQIYGHYAHEGRAPAFLDNLHQAFRMAPLFVLMEVMFKLGYRKDFQKHIHALVQANLRQFESEKQRKAHAS